MREGEARGWVNALLVDIKRHLYGPWLARRLEACGEPGIDKDLFGGTNFLTVQGELTGLEFIARAAGVEPFVFLEKWFPPEYKTEYPLLWEMFRHGHVHLFVPKSVIEGGVTVTSQVWWLNDRPDAVEENVRRDRAGYLSRLRKEHEGAHLDLIAAEIKKDRYYRVCPQILYADLKIAVERWLDDVATVEGVRRGFEAGVRALAQASADYKEEDRKKLVELLRKKGILPPAGEVRVEEHNTQPPSLAITSSSSSTTTYMSR